MYGLVNKAIQGLVVQRAGEDAWSRVAKRAGSPELFLSLETYSDDVSYSLVGAASEELGVDAGVFLRDLGEYWVTYTGKEGYGAAFDLWGTDMRTFLTNLDQMHGQVQISMPKLKPPSFSVFDEPDGRVRLSYYSSREGLAPMVVGLLEGLAIKFSTKVAIEHVVLRADEGHDEFLLTISDD